MSFTSYLLWGMVVWLSYGLVKFRDFKVDPLKRENPLDYTKQFAAQAAFIFSWFLLTWIVVVPLLLIKDFTWHDKT